MGNTAFLAELKIAAGALEAQANALRQDGATAIYLADGGKAVGIIAIADPIKASTVPALKALMAAGIRVIMLTGDNRITAAAVGRRLGIADVEADILPRPKAPSCEKLRRAGPGGRHGGGWGE